MISKKYRKLISRVLNSMKSRFSRYDHYCNLLTINENKLKKHAKFCGPVKRLSSDQRKQSMIYGVRLMSVHMSSYILPLEYSEQNTVHGLISFLLSYRRLISSNFLRLGLIRII